MPRRKSDDDIAFDEEGRPYAHGSAEVDDTNSAIFDDPDVQPLLVVGQSARGIGVRSYGPPSEQVADLLDQVARTYRQALVISRQPRN